MNIKDFLLGYEAGAAQGGGSSADVRYVTFMSHDGTVELGKKAVAVGDDCADPIARDVFDTPTKESTAQYNYSFVGWATTPNGAWDEAALDAVSEDRTVYAAYAATVRYYTITFYDDDGTTVLNTQTLAYGTTPSYTPTKTGHVFSGWTPDIATVTGDTSYTAAWEEKVTFATASWAKIAEICAEGTSADYFALGDRRTETLTYSDGTTENVTFEIVDLDYSNVYSNTTLVLMSTYSLATPQKFDEAATDYYAFSDMLEYLENTVYAAMPEDMRSALKSVSMNYANGSGHVHLPTTYMVVGEDYVDTHTADSKFTSYNKDIFEAFAKGKSRVCTLPSGTTVNWWSSRTNSQQKPVVFNTVGNWRVDSANASNYVRPICFV